MKRHLPRLVVASFAFVVGVASGGGAPYEIGRIQAYIDVARGEYRLEVIGTIDGDMEEFIDIAANDYGIEVVPRGCIISTGTIERATAYNDVSLAAIKRKYGDAIIETIWDRAQQQYRAKRLTH
ncbi:MAG TPA: hypothetical protein VLB87_02260 [Pyrinomonadaceae bacterium]|nr:hypothetical protein [Pyrinomonadaceae bacterium]